jgi:glycine/D-amino acid oxidase-like deaminating enzyme
MATTAILGGGFQGCCTAVALAEQGIDIVVYDQSPSLLSRTAVANEGKIHLGYMYASDPTLKTARTMIEGALAFAPFFERYLGIRIDRIKKSTPSNYALHKDSQRDLDSVSAYLKEVHRLVSEASNARESAYFGLDLAAPLRVWPSEDRDATFDPEAVLQAFQTPEVAINPEELAFALRDCISNHPRIEVRLGRRVLSADRESGSIRVSTEGPEGHLVDHFQHVVNALWDGRLVIDETMGLRPLRPWLYRLKYGITFSLPLGIEVPPSVTVISGPFGEIVTFPDKQLYLTWYPECLQGISADLASPNWPTSAPEPSRSAILRRTILAISALLPGLKPLNDAPPSDARVKGGTIVAWGETDIYDPKSELHRRCDIGITSDRRYHSIDPGKLTMIPYFAQKCVDRIIQP